MAARKPKPVRKGLIERTPLAEWTAAAIGAALTLGVVGYCIWEAVADDRGPPVLEVSAEPAKVVRGGHVVPLVVRNASRSTAAEVEVRGVLEQAGRVVEERHAVFAYVPGQGEARGGLVFERDPAAFDLTLSAEGYAEP